MKVVKSSKLLVISSEDVMVTEVNNTEPIFENC